MRRFAAVAPLGVGLAAALAVLAAGGSREDDLHQRLQEARLAAELSCGRPTLLASSPPDASALERLDWAALLEAAATGAPHERWRAIEILGEFGDARAVPALLGALTDRRGAVRPCLAAQALGRLGDARAVDELIAAAGQGGNEDLRLCAIKSLGLLRTERAVPVLVERVRSGEMLVAAAHALARIGTREGVEAVAGEARDPGRAPWLVGPLGEFGLEATEPELRQLTTWSEVGPGTRQSAREGLWKLAVLLESDREAALVEVLQSAEAPERRAWAAWRLGDEDFTGSTEVLAVALGDPSERVAMAAAAALLRFGPASEPSLLARAARPGPGRDLAVASLGQIGTEQSVRWLGSLGEGEAIEPLAVRSLRWLRYRGFSTGNVIARQPG